MLFRSLLSLIPQGVGVLISTPYMDEAARCSHVSFLRNGRTVMRGTPGELERPLAGRILEVRGEPRRTLRRAVGAIPGVESAQAFGDRVHARLRPGSGKAVLAALPAAVSSAGGRLEGAGLVRPTLEDAFLQQLEDEGGRA